jgi:hypothetical protein
MILGFTPGCTALTNIARTLGADARVGWRTDGHTDGDPAGYVLVWGARVKGCPMPEFLGADGPTANENLRAVVARGPRDWNDQE